MNTPAVKPKRALIVGVQIDGVSDEEHTSSLHELERLATTLGLEIGGTISQRRRALARAAVVGEGKLKEIAAWTGGKGYIPSPVPKKARAEEEEEEDGEEDVEDEAHATEDSDEEDEGPVDPTTAKPAEQQVQAILIDHDITPSQARNLERATGAEVLDRTAVILAIFHRHARSREARLEVEIARLAYLAPRMRELGSKERQRGGIGGRGAGESAMELDRRKIRDRIAELRRELEHIQRDAGVRRKKRSEQNTVALVGYTNAGKSSLMRALTGSEAYVADALFATLDTTVRALKPETRPRILVSDTVGFIKKLPHDLVASFRSTLDEAREAQLLLHVVDASDPAFEMQISVTRAVLGEVGAEAPTLLLMNKTDRLDEAQRADLAARFPDAVPMSAKLPAYVSELRQRIVAFFEEHMVEEHFVISYAHQHLVSEIHDRCRVLAETYDESGARMRVRAHPEVLARFAAQEGVSTGGPAG